LLLIVLGVSLIALPSAQAQDVKPDAGDAKDAGKPKEADDLAERLIRETVERADDDIMDRIMRLMDRSQRQLDIEFDPGAATQAVQARILDELDDAIKTAAMKRRPLSKAQQPARSDKRKSSAKNAKPDESSAGPSGDKQADAAPDSEDGRVWPMDANTARGALRERRRGWARLPQRDREEVIQGAGEKMLQRYRAWIDRYYRALQNDEDID